MLSLLGVDIPREAVGGISIGLAAAIGVMLLLDSVTPVEPLAPWRWGDAPRRAPAVYPFASHLAGAALCGALLFAALAL